MWEDTLTGVCKFHVRWLVHSSDVPKAFTRLQAARRAIADQNKTGRSSDDEEIKGASQPSGHSDDFDGDEVFLTSKREDVDIQFIVKPVNISFTISTKLSAHSKDERGPRLTHAFDASTGDFLPVESTDSSMKHPGARGVKAIAQRSKLSEEGLAANSEKNVKRSHRWLLPKQARSQAYASGGSGSGSCELSNTTTAAMSVCISESEGEASNSDNSNAREEAPQADGIESGNEVGHGDSSDSTDADCPDAMLRAPARESNPLVDAENMKRPRYLFDQVDDDVVDPPAQQLAISLGEREGKDEESRRKRPRRLTMPPVDWGTSPSPLSSEQVPSTSSPSKRRPSIRRGKARRRTVKVTAEETLEPDYPPRRTLVGEDYQVDIPDLLSVQERKRANVVSPAGTGGKMVSRAHRHIIGEYCRVELETKTSCQWP